MKVEAFLFAGLSVFFVASAIFYGIMTQFAEWVGGIALTLVAGLAGMIAFYLWVTAKRVGPRPEDRPDAEIHEGSGEQGLFSPWSWWPVMLGGSAAIAFLGVAIGWWIFFIGAGFGVISLLGWVYEYSRGDHAH